MKRENHSYNNTGKSNTDSLLCLKSLMKVSEDPFVHNSEQKSTISSSFKTQSPVGSQKLSASISQESYKEVKF